VNADATRTVFDGSLVKVVVETWGDREREIVLHPGSTTVVPIDDEGCLTLVRQFREAAGAPLLELPAGGLEDGEEPLASAQRELEEECGLTGGEWREVTAFWTTPGFVREKMHLFVAEGLRRGDSRQEDDESIELVRWPLAEIESRLAEIEDAKTLVGLLLYLRERRRE
jgi:ADP-ribose pyrophosphatase